MLTCGFLFFADRVGLGALSAMIRRRGIVIGVVVLFSIVGVAALALWVRPPSELEVGKTAYARGLWSEAAAAARQWLLAHPNDESASRLLARSLFRMGRDEPARDLYERIGIEKMEAEDCARLAQYLSRTGQIGAALRVWEEGLERDPRHPETLAELARQYTASQRLLDAVELVDRLRGVAGWAARAGVLLGLLRQELDDPEAAAEAFESALRADPALTGAQVAPHDVRKLLTRAYLSLGKPVRALEALTPLFQKGADRETAWLLSRVRLQSGDVPAAIAALRRGAELSTELRPRHEPAPYVGASRCEACHREIYESQQSSHHARTFLSEAALGDLDPPEKPIIDPKAEGVVHAIESDGTRTQFVTQRGGEKARATVGYQFGSNDRGATFVGIDDQGRWRELRLSHYGGKTWDLTTGHPSEPADAESGGAHAYLGRELGAEAVRRCLDCHTTNPRATRSAGFPTSEDRGIGCETCHGPGGHHTLAIAAAPDFGDLAIAQPSKASGRQITELCARCHSPLGMEARPDDPTSIRFQGTTLTWSRCFSESRGALSCVSCHDPHRDAETGSAYYEKKCLTCHSKAEAPEHENGDGARPIRLSGEIARKQCPVNPKNGCIECHMPTRSGVIPHTSFADHWIRVPHRD